LDGLYPRLEPKMRRPKVLAKCSLCGKEHLVHQCQLERTKNHFCSDRCRDLFYRGKDSPHYKAELNRVCANCGKGFRRRRHNGKLGVFCSPQCASKGKFNSNWRGGITPKRLLDRNSLRAEEWRKAVFERDQYMCQLCGQMGDQLTAHHLREFSRFPEQRWQLDNGITLCKECHEVVIHYLKNYRRKPIPVVTTSHTRFFQVLGSGRSFAIAKARGKEPIVFLRYESFKELVKALLLA
jgi:5-methylcytosine-specific restriction endonuclease McrA